MLEIRALHKLAETREPLMKHLLVKSFDYSSKLVCIIRNSSVQYPKIPFHIKGLVNYTSYVFPPLCK